VSDNERKDDYKRWIVLIHFLYCTFLLLVMNVYILSDTSWITTIYPVSLLAFGTYVWLIVSCKFVYKSLFSPYPIVLIAAIVFNGGTVILHTFGWDGDQLLTHFFAVALSVKTVFFTIMGLSFFHLGAMLSAVRENNRSIESNSTISVNPHAISIVGWLLFAVSVVPGVSILINQLRLVMMAGYFAIYQIDRDVGIVNNIDTGLADLLLTSLLLILAGSKGRKFDVTITSLFILFISIVNFFMGKRFGALIPVIAYLWLFDNCIKKVSRIMLLSTSIFVLVIVLPTVRVIRNISGVDRMQLDTMVGALTSINNPITSILSELGSTINATGYTLQLVTGSAGYDYGATYWRALKFILPGSIYPQRPEFATASDWLVWNVDPATASRGGGLGFSFIGEAFLSFGWFGVGLLFLIGYLLNKYSSRAIELGGRLNYALVACCLPYVILYTRGELILITRKFVWYAIIPYLMIVLLNQLFLRKRIRAEVNHASNNRNSLL
jgi:oligosaccharide repeat unit polymerase